MDYGLTWNRVSHMDYRYFNIKNKITHSVKVIIVYHSQSNPAYMSKSEPPKLSMGGSGLYGLPMSTMVDLILGGEY